MASTLPLVGTSPGVGLSRSRSRLCSPVTGLSLSGPVFCDLESGGRSCSRYRSSCNSLGSWDCWSSHGLAISGPILNRSALLATPVLLGGSSELLGSSLLGLSSLLPLTLLLLSLFRITVEEQIRHHLPRHVPRDRTPEPKNLPGQEPPHETDGWRRLVVAGNSHVNELCGRVHVAESYNGDVGVAGLGDGLMVGPGVADDKKPGLPEGGLDLISEGTGSEPSSNGTGSNVPCKLEYSSLGIGPTGHHEHISRILDGSNSPGSQHQLLPGLLQVDDVDTIGLLLEDVLLHRGLGVVGPNVGGSGQHFGDVILSNSENIQTSRHFESRFLFGYGKNVLSTPLGVPERQNMRQLEHTS